MKKSFYNIVKGRFLVSDDTFKNWRFVVFLSILALVMIGSSHTADKKVHRIARLSNEAKELKSEYLDVRKLLTQAKMESKLTAVMSKTGLQTSTIPPQKIIITKKQ
ncbi:FtsL-like putative cell division protein [Flavobacteriaceae bacterium]|nr:FtsL-like putative cell division protein [Flavobacteriaceae bacterium]MDB2630508.1 FtsL-like putative cell division protein [Ulvibacter sp.]MDB9858055.1 FtsL-like putative cell division protein [Flavobacteriaceae bacterium]MDB9964730.1 FtsL-like putative cell division protein [Flavobacteriaceae bacterium]